MMSKRMKYVVNLLGIFMGVLLLTTVGCGKKNKGNENDTPPFQQTQQQQQSTKLPKSGNNNKKLNSNNTNQNDNEGNQNADEHEQDDKDALKTCRIKQNLCEKHANDKTTCEGFKVKGNKTCTHTDSQIARCMFTQETLCQTVNIMGDCANALKYNPGTGEVSGCLWVAKDPTAPTSIDLCLSSGVNPCQGKTEVECQAFTGTIKGAGGQKLCTSKPAIPAKCEKVGKDPCGTFAKKECMTETHCEWQ